MGFRVAASASFGIDGSPCPCGLVRAAEMRSLTQRVSPLIPLQSVRGTIHSHFLPRQSSVLVKVVASTTDKATVGFTHRIVIDGPRTLIESTCIHCGFTIVGSVNDGLPELELNHLQEKHGIYQ
jgi:hypothetical protein